MTITINYQPSTDTLICGVWESQWKQWANSQGYELATPQTAPSYKVQELLDKIDNELLQFTPVAEVPYV